ncbi:MAG TPA: tetratricopeptide repeat protein [Terriglobales bacterium]|jgi:Flp pilus assembly protein TadD|nr:tetratricopeptide repeat protein [Terriglobales bacterium]
MNRACPVRPTIARPRITGIVMTLALMSAAFTFAQTPPPAARPVSEETPEVHMGKGYDALKNDRHDVAVAEFQAALKLDPKLTLRARFPLAVALFESHNPVEARREFETVRREAGDHPNILYYLGRLDLDDRNFPGAIRNLTQAASDPPFPDTTYYLGFACFKQGDLTAAEKWLGEAARANPHDARVMYQLGLVYQKQGRNEEANKAIAQSNEQRQRDSAESSLRLECAQKLDQGPREAAHALCEKLYDPDNADKLTALGTIYGKHGDPEAALKPLRRAAELAPQSPQMQYNVALAYYQLKRLDEARNALAPAADHWPDVFQLVALYGKVLAQLGDDIPAYQTLHHAHDLNPQDSETADLLYLSVLKLGFKNGESAQYGESLRYFEEAAKMRPQEPEPHVGMAAVYSQTGRSAQAAAEQKTAERLTQNARRTP